MLLKAMQVLSNPELQLEDTESKIRNKLKQSMTTFI